MKIESTTEAHSNHAVLRTFQHMIPALVLLNERIGRKLNLSAVDMQALHLIALHQSLQTPSALANRMEMPASTITRVLDRLENRGFIRRISNGSDRRSVRIERIDPAVAAVKSEFDSFAADMSALVAQFSPSEHKTIAHFLEKVCELL